MRRKIRNVQKVNRPFSPKKKVLRSSFPDFDFKRKCFLCGENADVQSEKKKEIGKRLASCVHFGQKIPYRMPVTRSDEWGTDVARRMSTIGDLIAAEARYHHTKCYIPFTNNRVKPGSTVNQLDFHLCYTIQNILKS